MTEWLKGCEICDAGMCAQMENYIACGMSERRASRELEKEQETTLGTKLYSAKSILNRYKRNTPSKKSTQNGSVQKEQTCAIEDLSTLIQSGKKFSTIYADPPWKYGNQGTRAATDNHYDTMTVDDIAGLPIGNLTEENAHLHIWTTNAFLFDTKKIIEAWGFEYKSCFVWVKPQMGIGNYWRVSHEFMLFGIKGRLPFNDRSIKSWVEISRTRHSKKPEDIADLIERVSPPQYLELFGRTTRDGWTVWGDEIERTLFNEAAFEKNLHN